MGYAVAFLASIAVGGLLWRAYRRQKGVAVLLKGGALVGLGLVFLAFTRSMVVYKPLMVLHMVAIVLYGYGVVRYLWSGKVRKLWLLAPLGSLALFFMAAWFFKEI